MNTTHKLGKCLATVLTYALLWACAPMAFAADTNPFKLLFSSPQDLTNTYGKLDISVTPVSVIRKDVPIGPMNDPTGLGGFSKIVGCFPLADGTWEVFSRQFINGTFYGASDAQWSLLRGITADGMTFKDVETVIPMIKGSWLQHSSIAYNPVKGEYMMLRILNDGVGHGYRAFFSSNGKQWKLHPNRLFYGGDAQTVFWSPKLQKYVVVSKAFEAFPNKHYPDHSPQQRRVLMIRTSPDGITWTPNNDQGYTDNLPSNMLTSPDAQDPLGLEFYSGSAFWYYDRAYMTVLNYAPSPMRPNDHAEQLGYEWWTSLTGEKTQWERPARETNVWYFKRIDLPPMIIGGKLLWLQDSTLIGLPEDRISGVKAWAPGEFSTKSFKMPQSDLFLNVASPSLDQPWFRTSPAPYVMVEVLDDQGKVIPGFERSKCLYHDPFKNQAIRDIQVDETNSMLKWGSLSARQLAGQNIRLRFYLSGSTIYAVTATIPTSKR